MKVRIYSIKNRENLKFICPILEKEVVEIIFPTFLLSIEELESEQIEYFQKEIQNYFHSTLMINEKRILIFGDLNSFKISAENLTNSFLSEVGVSINKLLIKYKSACDFRYKFGNKILSTDETYLMGILNLTKDSFYDGNKYLKFENAVKHIDEMIENGADIIDIGAESTRPGAEPIDPDLEFSILEPILDYLKTKDVIVSVDTYKSKVVEKCLKYKIDIVNDISGLKFDPQIADVINGTDCGLILMHIKGAPKDMQINPFYENTLNEIFDELEIRTKIAEDKGVEKIFVDPGIGFGKRLIDNYILLNSLDNFLFLGYPIVIGTSRKSFIGKILNQEPDQRLIGTIASNVASQMLGANILRVHDVKEMNQAKKIINLVKNPSRLTD